jgi:predicted helicase
MQFNDILKKYRKEAFSERDKGDKFERLMQRYLRTDPKYAYSFKKVWLWNDFPGRKDFGGKDTGIDLVAKTHEGDFWAIQCKCYAEDATIDKPSVDTFLSTSGRTFKEDESLKTTRFSQRLWISTTNNWGSGATEAIKNQDPEVIRLGLYELQSAPVDWKKLEDGQDGEASRTAKKSPYKHQKEAVDLAHAHFKENDRGQMIMACGTGKTYTALQVAENETKSQGLILFLVPSIALLGQTLREWFADANEPIHPICICSDPRVSRKQSGDDDVDATSVVDLALPASTNVKSILKQFEAARLNKKKGMTVVFSTYQSIDVIAEAQKALRKQKEWKEAGIFDLIICDEAHRTTGVSLTKEDSSAFIKVHDDDFIQARKRLYMTATPRLYNEDAKTTAAQEEAILCSMDQPEKFGTEFYRIGFGEAVERKLLTDYKVLILTLSDKDVPPAVQRIIANKESEINADDASKLIGCINALSKQVLGDEGVIKATDPDPMRRAVAFCQKIAVSKKITSTFNSATDVYIDALPPEKREQMVSVSSKHIDGTMGAPVRDGLMAWLKGEGEAQNECRILTNVRCLSEGVDVPSLDAVMFLSARNSQVDVVQSVGRVMRKSPGKNYGYIIIPVVVPADVDASEALDDNERYKVVWTVLNALRAHDDRFNATVNKIELNKKKPAQILIGRPDTTFVDGKPVTADPTTSQSNALSQQLYMQFEQLQDVMFARLVKKVGDRGYWENWAKDIAIIAERQMERITHLIASDGTHKEAFAGFMDGLRKNINPSLSEKEAVEMLSQHIITKPVFDALFEGYSFVKENPISQSMQAMLDLLEDQDVAEDPEALRRFYESVRKSAQGIDNAEGRQKIIVELYDKFFKTAFPRMVEKLGIVYTPVEVVDFIIHSVADVLQKEFGRSISDENVHILDPFTGTGTFITRLLQSGLIDKKDLHRKYTKEIHANEIVLLAYYIAAVNIENTYHDLIGSKEFHPFEGMCLTDTFQLGESDADEKLFSKMFPQNSERVARQKKAPIKVIFGNPPYSVGQKSANDNAQNQEYERLDNRIALTYAKRTKATNKNSLYDSYIKAFRWSSDRLDTKDGGILCFVTNGAWLDGNAQDGFRACLQEEFSSIHVFDLRGNQRTSGELSRKEGGKIFGSGSRTPIAITLLVKNPKAANEKATIHYHDIGDYLKREEKLEIIQDFGSVVNAKMKWRRIKPDDSNDWLNQGSDVYDQFIALAPDKKHNSASHSFFTLNSMGIGSRRDSWVLNSSKRHVISNMERMVMFYNKQVVELQQIASKGASLDVQDFINKDDRNISWSSSLISSLEKRSKAKFEASKVDPSMYRPFFRQFLYRGDKMIHRRGQVEEMFPTYDTSNTLICISGVGVTKDFSALGINSIPDEELTGKSQCFPLHYYQERSKANPNLFDGKDGSELIQRDGITDFILDRARKQYGNKVSKEDIFYYVYGFLHSPEYRSTFTNDLKKSLPRLPLVDSPKAFWAFSKAGRQLAELHINYEEVPPHPDVVVEGAGSKAFKVKKLRFPKKDQKDTILYNSQITIKNIPAKAYEYVVNGRSAIEWIIDRYQVKTDPKSGITNDPNDWAEEVGNPRYILDLILSVINVSTQTVDIVAGLPKAEFE